MTKPRFKIGDVVRLPGHHETFTVLAYYVGGYFTSISYIFKKHSTNKNYRGTGEDFVLVESKQNFIKALYKSKNKEKLWEKHKYAFYCLGLFGIAVSEAYKDPIFVRGTLLEFD